MTPTFRRKSCDACFQRRVKCDRSSRAASGCHICSKCDLDQIPCTLQLDICVQQRRRKSPKLSVQRRRKKSPKPSLPVVGRGTNTPISTGTGQQFGCSNNELNCAQNTALDFSNNTLLSNQLRLDDFTVTTTQSPMMTNWGSVPIQALQLINEPQNNPVAIENPYSFPYLEPNTLDAAIDAYFTFASLALPVLSREGFMTDYTGHLSSPALVYAVACRGCSFIQTPEKWAIQQQLASRFRETFLQAQSTTSGQNVIRLDDLEALALMVDFEYESSEWSASPLQSRLRNPLLTHDSLVVMALHYRIVIHLQVVGGYTTLSRATQRQYLLFRYVYGWDAFFSLDRKVASRIRGDEVINLPIQFHENESQTYFDAILSLAGIARKIARTLCGPIARSKGAMYQDIENLYKQLEEWHTNICPPALQIQLSSRGSSQPEQTLSIDTETKRFPPLHKAIVTLLELSCFMQLEACVSQYGIEERDSSMGQIINMRVTYETLQAAYRIVEVAQWIEKLTISQRTSASVITHVMADLAPGVIRNICAGASNWISRRAKEIFHLASHDVLNLSMEKPDYTFGGGNIGGLLRSQARSWMESLTTLRDIAATATSHQDTEHLIKRLDQKIGSLKELFNKIRE